MDSIDDKYWDAYENYGRLGRDADGVLHMAEASGARQQSNGERIQNAFCDWLFTPKQLRKFKQAAQAEAQQTIAELERQVAEGHQYRLKLEQDLLTYGELQRQLAAQQQQIAVYREALEANHSWHSAYDEYGGYPESDLCEQNTKALAQPFDTSALERYRDEVLEEAANNFYDNATDEQFTNGCSISWICAELRRMKKG